MPLVLLVEPRLERLEVVDDRGGVHLPLSRYAGYFSRNAASGRVMEKNGMKREGMLRQHVRKWDEYVDVVYYGILREEWKSEE